MAYNVVNLPKITVNIKKWSNVGFKTKIVDELPETGEEGIIYLLSARKSSSLIQKTSTTYAIPLATIQTEVIYKKDFTVDNITGIKAGMTLRFVGNGTMGEATVESVTVSTKTVTMTNPISLSTGTLVFDNATWSHDSYNEYIWNITNGSFEKLGLIDLNVQSKAVAQSIVGRDWGGRAQIENPSADKDIANKSYVDAAVADKITMGDLVAVTDEKLDKTALGNFTFDTNTLKDTNANAKIILGSDGSQYIPNDLEITNEGISRNNLNDGMGVNNWSITGGGSVPPTMEVRVEGVSKSETFENIIDAPSKKQDILVSGTNIKTINGESVLGEGNITVTPTTDDALSDTSTNAVQNKVVKAAIDGKLDRITEGNVLKLYSHTGAKQSEVEATTNLSGGTVPLRDGHGNLQTKTVVNDLDVTNKKYVDDRVSSALTLTSPNGTKYKITVDDTGTLSATEIGQ